MQNTRVAINPGIGCYFISHGAAKVEYSDPVKSYVWQYFGYYYPIDQCYFNETYDMNHTKSGNWYLSNTVTNPCGYLFLVGVPDGADSINYATFTSTFASKVQISLLFIVLNSVIIVLL